MIVKFIMTDGRIFLGRKPYANDQHMDIAKDNKISKKEVKGGGLADLESHRIFGTSYGFGPYNPKMISRMLPNWRVDPPSDYKI